MFPRETPTVLIVDNDPLARHAYRSLLERMVPPILTAGEAASAEEAMNVVLSLQPQVVLLDLHLGDASGLQLARALFHRGYEGAILVVSVLPEAPHALQALEAGAAGYLRKEDVPHHLGEAIQTVARGGTYLRPPVAAWLLHGLVRSRSRSSHPALTHREQQTLALLARGLSNKEIAAHLDCSTRTAKAHVSQVLRKLGVEDRTQAALLAVRFGLVETVVS